MTRFKKSTQAANPASKVPRSLIALLAFVAFGLLGLALGFGKGAKISTIGNEVCKATCVHRGWRDGWLVPAQEATSGPRDGPKTCQCR